MFQRQSKNKWKNTPNPLLSFTVTRTMLNEAKVFITAWTKHFCEIAKWKVIAPF